MSFEIFLQRFRGGGAHAADPEALQRALSPYLVRVEHGWNLHADSATAEIFGIEDLSTGFMVTHIDGPEIYGVLTHVARTCDLVIMAIGAPTAVTREEQLAHLPDELRDGAVLVTTGSDVRALIAGA